MPGFSRVLPIIALTALLAYSPPRGAASPGGSEGGAIQLERVDGEQVLKVVRESGAPAVLVNVWATWCIPCREEFPDLIRLYRQYRDRGFRLILISADFASEEDDARAFLAEHGVDFPSYLKVGDDMEFINTLDERWTGALPASFIYDVRGNLQHFWEGKASYEQMKESVLEVLRASAEASG